jgi:hypothetical protein
MIFWSSSLVLVLGIRNMEDNCVAHVWVIGSNLCVRCGSVFECKHYWCENCWEPAVVFCLICGRNRE